MQKRHYQRRVREVLSAVVALIALVLPLAWARAADSSAVTDTNASSAASADDQGSKLEEIVVTARRREENLQSVPIAVSVVSQQALEQNNVQTIGSLQYLVPSMTAGAVYTRDAPNVFIRGQGANFGSQPGVEMYLDEVPLPVDSLGDLAGGPGLLFDLENVQVLKGPQGTLFGRNSDGGAVLLQTARPTQDFGGDMQVGYGNYNDREIDGHINIPIISDVLLTRVAVNGQLRDGFTDLLAEPGHPNGIDADNRDYWSIRATIAYHPIDWFQNDTMATYSTFNSNGNPLILTAVNPKGTAEKLFPDFMALFAEQQALGVRTALPIDNEDQSSGRNVLLSNISTIQLNDDLKLRNILGYDSSRLTFQQDNDGTVFNIAAAPYYPTTEATRQVTEEAQLLGQSFAKRLDWIVGAFYLNQPDRDYYRSTTFLFNGLSDNDTLTAFATKSQALFGQATYDLSALAPGLKLTGGLRYTWDDLSNANLGPAPGSPPLGLPYGGVPGPKSFCGSPPINCSYFTGTDVKNSALTWTGGVDYQATTDTLLYFTSRRGYRAGGSNGLNAAGELYPSYGPEYVVDFEVGAKSDWTISGMPIRTDADLYYDDYTGIQANQQTYVNNVLSNIVTNSGKGRIWGAELEALANVTSDLQLGLNFDYLNFEYTSFEPGVNPTTVVGTRTANRPPYKYSLDGRYHLPVPTDLGNVSLRAIWTWQANLDQTGTSLVPALPPGAAIAAFGLLNVSADWDNMRGSNFDTSFFMSNALDKTYSIGGFGYYNNLGFSVQRYGEPRMYGIRLRYRFGAEGHH